MMDMIRLMLVDDHDVVRAGLAAFLDTQPGLTVVAEAGSGEEALLRLHQVQPDVILMDISMPDMDGMQVTRQIRLHYPACKVLALTVHDEKRYFVEMLAAGAEGYITKQAAVDELVAAIRTVAAGQVYLQPTLARWLLEDYLRLTSQNGSGQIAVQPQPISLQVLSQRERQVLEMVAVGMTTPQIAGKLGLSPKTVSRHRERIMSKLNLHSGSELIKFAIRVGMIALT